MRQFWEAKKAHPNTLMLFRMGDFYETFDKDALTASNILGITLTKRANGAAASVPLAGFPHHALDQYLHKLLKAGHRVAICEQVEDPKLAKGIVKREVVEVVSPGTALSERYLDQRENNFLASVHFGKSHFGLALLDHSTGEFLTGEWPIPMLSNIIRQFKPAEILVSEDHSSQLNTLQQTAGILVTPWAGWIFDHHSAYSRLTEQFGTSNLKGFGIEELNLGISAAGGALEYVSENFKGRTQHITRIAKVMDDGILGLDSHTVRNLELFQSLASQGVHGTLISVLDQTTTSMGSRMLKQWLKRPLADQDQINTRLDRVEELLNDSDLCDDVRRGMRGISDLDRIISRLSAGRATPRDVVQLGFSLEQIPVYQNLFTSNQPALNELTGRFRDTVSSAEEIRRTLREDPPAQTAKGGYIADGFSPELDELRELSRDASQWIVRYQLEEQEKTGIPSLKVGFNKVFGYYIEVTKTHQEKVPESYIRKQTLVNSERYFTPELKEYEDKILTAEERIVTIEAGIFAALQNQIMSQAGDIQHNARILARLDIAAALAEAAGKQNYCRPVVENSSILEVTDSRHPVVEKLLPVGENFIPNDLSADCDKFQIGIITGPNMAGKSTFLRQIGLLVVMAQIGSFIPAASARIGIVDKLFTRVGASDNLAGGESTFLVEMNETANILNNATSRSLIILDEIGRGTSTYDGLSIAWAVTEYLHNKSSVAGKTLFATHYHELVELADQLPRAYNLNVAVKEFGSRVVFLRKIIPGGADRSYGIHVAEMAGLPRPVVERAHEILHQLDRQDEHHPDVSLQVNTASQMSLFGTNDSALREELDSLDVNQLTPMEALLKLDEIKRKHGL